MNKLFNYIKDSMIEDSFEDHITYQMMLNALLMEQACLIFM